MPQAVSTPRLHRGNRDATTVDFFAAMASSLGDTCTVRAQCDHIVNALATRHGVFDLGGLFSLRKAQFVSILLLVPHDSQAPGAAWADTIENLAEFVFKVDE